MSHHPDNLVQTTVPSPLGPLLLAAGVQGLAGVWFENQRHRPDPKNWPEDPHHPVLQRAVAQLDAYFTGELQRFDLPLDLGRGTPFQQAVWRALIDLAPGQTTRYGDLARGLGRPRAARAVGAAVGRNPLSIVVPCHRVLGAAGALTGYAGGLERKQALLRLEGLRR